MKQDKIIVFLAGLVWPFDFIIKSTCPGDASTFFLNLICIEALTFMRVSKGLVYKVL